MKREVKSLKMSPEELDLLREELQVLEGTLQASEVELGDVEKELREMCAKTPEQVEREMRETAREVISASPEVETPGWWEHMPASIVPQMSLNGLTANFAACGSEVDTREQFKHSAYGPWNWDCWDPKTEQGTRESDSKAHKKCFWLFLPGSKDPDAARLQQRIYKSRLKTPAMVREIGLPRVLVQEWWNTRKFYEKESWRLKKEMEKEKREIERKMGEVKKAEDELALEGGVVELEDWGEWNDGAEHFGVLNEAAPDAGASPPLQPGKAKGKKGKVMGKFGKKGKGEKKGKKGEVVQAKEENGDEDERKGSEKEIKGGNEGGEAKGIAPMPTPTTESSTSCASPPNSARAKAALAAAKSKAVPPLVPPLPNLPQGQELRNILFDMASTIADRNRMIEEKDRTIEEKDLKIRRLEEQLEEGQQLEQQQQQQVEQQQQQLEQQQQQIEQHQQHRSTVAVQAPRRRPLPSATQGMMLVSQDYLSGVAAGGGLVASGLASGSAGCGTNPGGRVIGASQVHIEELEPGRGRNDDLRLQIRHLQQTLGQSRKHR